jgi:hypoxanthine phosphoribosyltransferase
MSQLVFTLMYMETKLERKPNIQLGPDDVHAAIFRIVDQIENSGINYDVIVAPARGGLIPGVRLSHQLNIPLLPIMYSLRDFYSVEQHPMIQLNKYVVTDRPLNVLLVEDIVDSGKTVNALLLDTKTLFADTVNVDVASVITNVGQTMVDVKYSGITFDKRQEDRWVDFWWEERI